MKRKKALESGAPGAIPTRDLPLRRRTLYATELREQASKTSQQIAYSKTVNGKQETQTAKTLLWDHVSGWLLMSCLLFTTDTSVGTARRSLQVFFGLAGIPVLPQTPDRPLFRPVLRRDHKPPSQFRQWLTNHLR